MADHYFSNDPSSKSDRKRWEFTLRESRFTFLSDHGVFSKNEVDFGSRLLIEAFQMPGVRRRVWVRSNRFVVSERVSRS